MLPCKISKLFIRTIVQLWILQVIISFFSKTLLPRNMNFFFKEYPYGLIYKINLKFLGRTVSEKNAMLTYKISKLVIRTNCATLNFCKLLFHFSRKLCDRWTWSFFLHRVSIWVNIQKLMSSSSVAQYRRKMWCYFQVIITFFSKTVRLRNLNFFLQRISIWAIIQKKFQVPRSHSIGEKWDVIFKLSSHFSRILCDRGAWNFFCKEHPYGLIHKKNFKFLGCTVSEENANLISRYNRIFLKNCETKEHEVLYVWSIHMG